MRTFYLEPVSLVALHIRRYERRARKRERKKYIESIWAKECIKVVALKFLTAAAVAAVAIIAMH